MNPCLVIFLGFLEHPSDPDPIGNRVGTGMLRLRDKIEATHPTMPVDVFSWDTDPNFAVMTVLARKPDWIGLMCYSHGIYGASRFQNVLSLQDIGIRHFGAVAPVPYHPGNPLAPLFPTKEKIVLSCDPEFLTTAREVNGGWGLPPMPWEREMFTGSATVLSQTSFGSRANLDKWQPEGDQIEDAQISHVTIDDDPRVHSLMIRDFEVALESGIAA
jgi:hypothetical protein